MSLDFISGTFRTINLTAEEEKSPKAVAQSLLMRIVVCMAATYIIGA
jgi:hypothetical protein